MPSAFLLLNCKLGCDKEVVDSLWELSIVTQVLRVYGAYEIIVKLVAETVEELQKVLKSDLKVVDNIVSKVILITKDI